jgi:hypothetical protein
MTVEQLEATSAIYAVDNTGEERCVDEARLRFTIG